MSEFKIYPINTGFIKLSKEKYLYHHSTHKFYDTEGYVDSPCYAFLLKSKDTLALVDTGMASTEIANKYHHAGSVQPEGFSIIDQLAKMGIKPADIDAIIFTHLHWDHCYHVAEFHKATLYVSRAEYEWALNPIPLYYKSYEYPAIGIRQQFDGLSFNLTVGEQEIMPGLSVYQSPGHSLGHQTVAVQAKSGHYHCCGDLMFTNDSMKPLPEISYTITPPGRFLNIVDSWRSIEDINRRKQGDRFVLACHEPLVGKMAESLGYLE